MSLTTIFIGLIIVGGLLFTAFSGTALLRCPKCKKIGSLRPIKEEEDEEKLSAKADTLDEELVTEGKPTPVPDYICKNCGNAIRLPR